MPELRRFTAKGLREFVDYLNPQRGDDPGEPPSHLLFDTECSHVSRPRVELSDPVTFDSKFDLGLAICTSLGTERIPRLLEDDMVWPWLSLYYSASTMPFRNGRRFLGDKARHVIGDPLNGWKDYDHAHRHLVRTAVQAVFTFRDRARVLMERPDQHTKLEEQLLSRKAALHFAYSQQLVEVIHLLYWDPEKGRARRGAKSTGAGSIVRLMDVLRQLEVNFDLLGVDSARILDLLPRPEFTVRP